MSVEKFNFVSPGVKFSEIDESVIVKAPPGIGPLVIGRTARGPAMQPVQVTTISELERVFGAPTNGVVGSTDVFRTNAATSPTFASYAAKAFLRNSGPVTVIRLAGTEKNDTSLSGDPGWSAETAYKLYAVTGSVSKLAAVFYTDATGSIKISGSVGGYAFDSTGSLLADNTFKLMVSSSVGGEIPFTLSLDQGSPSYIRSLVNVNPTKYSAEHYFLGESFENSNKSGSYTSLYLEKTTATSSTDFNYGLRSAKSAIVVGDHTSAGASSAPELFLFHALHSGTGLSSEIKISIENVRPSPNLNVTQYGTFDVVVRKLFEIPNQSTVLETFKGVSLDSSADNYIEKVIGNMYRQWDADSKRYNEYGEYDNNSAFIRVEVLNSSTSLPHGFKTAGVPSLGVVGTYTASYPNVTTFESSVTKTVARNTRFGLVSDYYANKDLVDILRFKPESATLTGSVVWSTRYIVQDPSNSANYKDTFAGTKTYNTTDLLATGAVLGFNLPLQGGFDGVDITEQEPFINEKLLNSQSEAAGAAYRTVSIALDMCVDPELMDFNVLAVPGLKKAELTQKMIDICSGRGDSIAIIDLEGDYQQPYETNGSGFTAGRPKDTTQVVNNLKARGIDSSYGAAYFPAVFDQTEGIFLPSSIAALGAFGGTEGRSAVWFAPAGFNRGGLTIGSSGVSVSRTALTLNSADRDALYAVNINPIATFPGEGVVIFGQKTLQVIPSALDRVNVRRLMNFIKKQISRAATRVLFEPDIKRTWDSFKNVVDPFLMAIKGGYGLEDAKVVLDETTTTADLIDRNIMYCKIYIKPTRAIEYIGIDFIVTSTGASFSE
jgi:hypothetical protein